MRGASLSIEPSQVSIGRGPLHTRRPGGTLSKQEGKSNIIEGLRWVLGEQSAKNLRGGKMPDVIFAGSQTRAPLNRCMVQAVFDNTDHYLKNQQDDVTITRKIYRNGDSEYLINGKQARLRDIVDLFTDTGVGRESFSIISQGSVEEIFNSKPQDRRMLIEEAAGIVKYKKEKSKAFSASHTRTRGKIIPGRDLKDPFQEYSTYQEAFFTPGIWPL